MTSDLEGSPQGAVVPEAAPSKSGFQRLAGVLFAPVETFMDIARRPDILIPLAVILVISIITSALIAPRVDFETAMREQMAEAGNMSAEDVDRVVRFSSAFAKVMIYVAPLLNLVVFAIVAGILLLAFRLFGGEGTFKQAYSVTLYAWMPLIIQGVIGMIILVTRGEVDIQQLSNLVMSNLSFLVDMKENPVAYALLSSLDAFTIWTLILFIIGFSVVSQLSRGKSAAIVLTLWAVTLIFKVGFAALGAARAAGA